MACIATDCATCRGTNGCGWSGTKCGPVGDGFQQPCASAHAGALVAPAPPLRDDPDGMARLGSVGYVDPYRGLQRVPAEAVTYGKYLQGGYETYMTGTKMQSCRPTLHYEHGVVLSAGGVAALRQKDGTVVFRTGSATPFLLRPPPGADRTAGELRYGDSVVLTTSMTASNSCGVYGCEVGRVVDGRFEVGPGGAAGGTPLTLEPPPGEGYEGAIPYGAPVFLSARLAPTGQVLRVGDALRPTEALESPSGMYRLVYNDDGTLGVYSTDQRTIWTTGEPHTPGRLKLTDGALVAYTKQGVPAWNIQVHGRGPYTLQTTDAGRVELRGHTSVLWASPADPQPGIPPDAPRLLGRLAQGKLVFGSRDGTRFTLDTRPGKRCDVDTVAKLCGDKCPGFLYSEGDATWQPLTADAGDYRSADTLQHVVLKAASTKLSDGSCPAGDATVIDEFGTPMGDLSMEGSSQCGPPKATNALPQAYAESASAAARATATLTEVVSQTRPKLKALRAATKEKVNPTVAQQALDWQVVNSEYKSHAVLWGLLAAVGVVLAVMVARRVKAK